MSFPNPLYVLTKGGIYNKVTGALSAANVDVVYFDGTNYRDTMDAAFQGANIQTNGANTNAAGAIVPTPGSLTAQTDEFTHTAPHNESFKITMKQFWDGAGGTGNLVGEIPLAKFINWFPEPPIRV